LDFWVFRYGGLNTQVVESEKQTTIIWSWKGCSTDLPVTARPLQWTDDPTAQKCEPEGKYGFAQREGEEAKQTKDVAKEIRSVLSQSVSLVEDLKNR